MAKFNLTAMEVSSIIYFKICPATKFYKGLIYSYLVSYLLRSFLPKSKCYLCNKCYYNTVKKLKYTKPMEDMKVKTIKKHPLVLAPNFFFKTHQVRKHFTGFVSSNLRGVFEMI